MRKPNNIFVFTKNEDRGMAIILAYIKRKDENIKHMRRGMVQTDDYVYRVVNPIHNSRGMRCCELFIDKSIDRQLVEQVILTTLRVGLYEEARDFIHYI